ncbi:hypothetical protein Fmac_028939 [Flemingia macrophylla]|uniref:Heparanase-like protein 2 n=1 Tax=Flemingia macrophylla TaxID=520843 RepID=A0ABD1LAD8_9FABA
MFSLESTKSRVKLIFGLNALTGKKNTVEDKLNWVGNWNPKNAISLMKRPKVIGPGGFYGKEWFQSFLLNVAPGVVDGVTHHIYNLGAGVDKDLINKIQDPFYLSQVAETFKSVAQAVKEFTPWAAPWVGEAGGAYNSGSKDPGVTVLLINMSNSITFNVSLVDDMNLYPILKTVPGRGQKTMREEYHLTPKDGNIQSDVVLLNGTPLQLTKSLDIPKMKPQLVDASFPITTKPDSIIFIRVERFNALTCG